MDFIEKVGKVFVKGGKVIPANQPPQIFCVFFENAVKKVEIIERKKVKGKKGGNI